MIDTFDLTVTDEDRQAAKKAMKQDRSYIAKCCMIWQALTRTGHPVRFVGISTASDMGGGTYILFRPATKITFVEVDEWDTIELPMTFVVQHQY